MMEVTPSSASASASQNQERGKEEEEEEEEVAEEERGGGTVKVVCRFRPQSKREQKLGGRLSVRACDGAGRHTSIRVVRSLDDGEPRKVRRNPKSKMARTKKKKKKKKNITEEELEEREERDEEKAADDIPDNDDEGSEEEPNPNLNIKVGAAVGQSFKFDRVFHGDATQQQVHAYVGAPIVRSVLQGYNGTVLAYGQTSSGKTHTMMGPKPSKSSKPSMTSKASKDAKAAKAAENMKESAKPAAETQGLLPRMLEQLFEGIAEAPEHVDFEVTASFVEIHLDRVNDLLAPRDVPPGRDRDASAGAAGGGGPSGRSGRSGRSGPSGSDSSGGSATNLAIREDAQGGIWVEGCREQALRQPRDALAMMRRGEKNRATASTLMNAASSRSHAVVMVKVLQRDMRRLTSKSSKLFLVDLAGSEKVDKSGATGARLDEAKTINKSLSSLGNVIHALTDEGAGHVPYRDSKLTRLLQQSLGGNSKTVLCVCCSPSSFNHAETVSTLRFGARAKLIKNHAKINHEFSAAELKRQLAAAQLEVLKLRAALASKALPESAAAELAGLREEASSLRERLEEGAPGPRALEEGKEKEELCTLREECASLKLHASGQAAVHAELVQVLEEKLGAVQEESGSLLELASAESATLALRLEAAREDARAAATSSAVLLQRYVESLDEAEQEIHDATSRIQALEAPRADEECARLRVELERLVESSAALEQRRAAAEAESARLQRRHSSMEAELVELRKETRATLQKNRESEICIEFRLAETQARETRELEQAEARAAAVRAETGKTLERAEAASAAARAKAAQELEQQRTCAALEVQQLKRTHIDAMRRLRQESHATLCEMHASVESEQAQERQSDGEVARQGGPGASPPAQTQAPAQAQAQASAQAQQAPAVSSVVLAQENERLKHVLAAQKQTIERRDQRVRALERRLLDAAGVNGTTATTAKSKSASVLSSLSAAAAAAVAAPPVPPVNAGDGTLRSRVERLLGTA